MQKTTSPHSPASKPYAHPPTPSSKPSSSTATIQTCAKIASTYSPPPKTSSPTTATFENSNPTALYSRGYARIAHLGNTGFFLSPYFAFAQYGLLSRLFRIRSIRRLGSGYVLGLAPLRAYAYAVALLPAGNTRNFCRPISPVGLNTASCRAYFAFAPYGAYRTPATMPQSDD